MKLKYFTVTGIFLFVLFSFVQAANYPFPQAVIYPYGNKPTSQTQNTMNNDVQTAYQNWKNDFLLNTGIPEAGMWRVSEGSSADYSTCSEGQGYGMLIMVYMDNATNNTQQYFDGLWNYYDYYKCLHGVMNWRIDQNAIVTGFDGATDGDIDAAFALILADKQWGSGGSINYAQEATILLNSIVNCHLESGTDIIQPGCDWGGTDFTRPSDYCTAEFQIFYQFTGNTRWNNTINYFYNTLLQYFYTHDEITNYTGFVPDFCKADGTECVWCFDNIEGEDRLGVGTLYVYGYNSCRVPWRVGWTYCWYGNNHSNLCYNNNGRVSDWFNTAGLGNPYNIKNGYYLDGTAIGTEWDNPVFVAPVGVAAMSYGNQTWLNAYYDDIRNMSTGGEWGYYRDSIRLLCMLLMTGNMPDIYAMGTPTKIINTASPLNIQANGSSTSLITARICNTLNNVVTFATNVVTFSKSGPGTLLDPTTRSPSYGIATVRMQSTTTAGTVTVTATSINLSQGTVNVTQSNTNNNPHTPSNPSPSNGATNQSVNVNLGWTGGDPDSGDTVTYDVYFEANDSSPDVLVSNNQAGSTYNPGTLGYNTHYYWKIVATDNHGASTTGPVWDFTTMVDVTTPTKKWDFLTGGDVKSSPAIGSGGTIYVGSYDNKLYAINPNGTKKWEFLTSGLVQSSAAIDYDGTIYVGSFDGKLYAINPNGTKKWEFLTGNGTEQDYSDSSPAIGSDGTIYVGSYIGRFYAINPDGTKKWEFLTSNDVWSSPAIDLDGTIYVGSWHANKLYAINPDGTKKWEFLTGWYVESSPIIGSDGTIYVGSNDNKFYAINPNGTKKWEFLTSGLVLPSPAIGSDGTIYVGSIDKKLYAINPNGTKKWEFLTGGYVYSSPAIGSDGTIYFGSNDNKFYAIYGSGSLADSSWPMFKGDPKHTGLRQPGPAVKLVSTAQPRIITADGASTSLITTMICDNYNNVVKTTTNEISFSISGFGSLLGTTIRQGVDGIATVVLQSSICCGSGTVTATSSGLSQGDVSVQWISGTCPIILTISASPTQIIADGISTVLITSEVRDECSNELMNGSYVEYSISGEGTLLGDSYVHASSGIADIIYQSTTRIGTATITATSAGMVNSDVTVNIINISGLPSKIIVTAEPTNIMGDGTSTSLVTAMICDANTNPETNATNEIIFNVSGVGSLLGTIMKNAENGIATVMYLSGVTVNPATVSAAASGLSQGSIVIYNCCPCMPEVKSILAEPENICADGLSTSLISAVVKDGCDLVVTYEDVYFSISDEGTLIGTTVRDTSSGQATIILQSTITPGTVTVSASSVSLIPMSVNVMTIENYVTRENGSSISKEDSFGKTSLDILANSMDVDSVTVEINNLIDLQGSLLEAITSANDSATSNSTIEEVLTASIRELKPSKEISFDTNSLATIKIYYPDDGSGKVDGTELDENDLRIYLLNEDNEEWGIQDSKVYPNDNYVETKISHLSVYCLMGVNPEELLTDVIVYPNPTSGETTFIYNLLADADVTIKVYTLSGRLINIVADNLLRTSGPQDEDTWNGTDAANGVYIYKLTATPTGGGAAVTKTGKIVIMR